MRRCDCGAGLSRTDLNLKAYGSKTGLMRLTGLTVYSRLPSITATALPEVGELSRLGVDLYLTGATHIITLVKAEFLWRLGAIDQESTESCGGTSSGWIFRDIIEGVKRSCVYGAVAAGVNIMPKAIGLRIALGKSFQRVDIDLGLREYVAICNLGQGE